MIALILYVPTLVQTLFFCAYLGDFVMDMVIMAALWRLSRNPTITPRGVRLLARAAAAGRMWWQVWHLLVWPLLVVTPALLAADIMRDSGPGLVVDALYAWIAWRHRGCGGDPWRRLRRKATEAIKVIGGRLVVTPVSPTSTPA